MNMSLGELTAAIREINVEKGWRPTGGGLGDRTFGDYLALLHSEISEALEAFREHGLADATDEQTWAPESVADMERGHTIPKPEGVGSELADVVIRLLDMCDVFGLKPFDMDCELADMEPLARPDFARTFGDDMAWLHFRVAAIDPDVFRADTFDAWRLSYVLRALAGVAERYGIDLAAEVERKLAFNRTRLFRHGGKAM